MAVSLIERIEPRLASLSPPPRPRLPVDSQNRLDLGDPRQYKYGKITSYSPDPNLELSRSAARVRQIVRGLEENYDLAKGALDLQCQTVIGTGIHVEPQVKTQAGELHRALNEELAYYWARFVESPEISGEMSWMELLHLAYRQYPRDGETLVQEIIDSPAVKHRVVPYALELIDPALVPHDYNDGPIQQGIRRNGWGQARAFYVQKQYHAQDYRVIPAQRMIHLANRDRVNQWRGMSQYQSVIKRFYDLNEYENSDRLAARMAAALLFAITREKDWQDPNTTKKINYKDVAFQAGMILNLAPGDDIKAVQSNRPNPQLLDYLSSQTRPLARALPGVNHSSLANDYNGNYTAQRQEMVEGFASVKVQQQVVIDRMIKRIYRRFVQIIVATGKIRVPPDVLMRSLDEAQYRAPVMNWVDIYKEMQARVLGIDNGLMSRAQVMRDMGQNPTQTMEQIRYEQSTDTRATTNTPDAATASTGEPLPTR